MRAPRAAGSSRLRSAPPSLSASSAAMAPGVSMAPREAAAPGVARGPGGLARAQDRVGDCVLQRQAGMAWQAGRRRPGPRPAKHVVGGGGRNSGRWGEPGLLGVADRILFGACGLAGYRPTTRPSLGLRAPRPVIWARGRQDGCDLPPWAAGWKWPFTGRPGFRAAVGLEEDFLWRPSSKLLALGCSCIQALSVLGDEGKISFSWLRMGCTVPLCQALSGGRSA